MTRANTFTTPSANFICFGILKNSIAKREVTTKKPANIPSEFQEPKTLSILLFKTPSDKIFGINKWIN